MSDSFIASFEWMKFLLGDKTFIRIECQRTHCYVVIRKTSELKFWYSKEYQRLIYLTLVLLMAMDWSVEAAAMSSLLQLFWPENTDASPPDCNEIGAECGYDVNSECCAESLDSNGFLRLIFDDMIIVLALFFVSLK